MDEDLERSEQKFEEMKRVLASLGVETDKAETIDGVKNLQTIVGEEVIGDGFALSWYYILEDGSVCVSLLLLLRKLPLEIEVVWMPLSQAECWMLQSGMWFPEEISASVEEEIEEYSPRFYEIWNDLQVTWGEESDALGWIRQLAAIFLGRDVTRNQPDPDEQVEE